ncbi:uncharacterized protein FOMMEDRAFT_145033 [Fomitiporia mediterranea MF3/22]|uniref:uncharacterized protein n=1 Tax=Fomitiporia mediterranea (strain MF3/22) TaxID=694068 RepID=UPI0004408437|nr:uncharacterized protein FOMMEDRAFT_145033 [Fomitiporia mediterranea MF3/22]EJD05514.1 hypothetical protein FOMMEDRAFT_145033 [Fomitiporia mediterranea MF3/22]
MVNAPSYLRAVICGSFPLDSRKMQNSTGLGYTTHPSLHLRDAHDAHVVFEAVRLGLLPLIKRRLTSEERDQLCSGNVFVWEEAEHKGGLERWTDGRRWSQSRMKGEYLFYEEKVETTEEEKQAKAARRASRNAGHPVPNVPTRRQDRPAKPNGLTKQTYSTQVYLSSQQSPRKWHIVAYFSGTDYTRLPVIENFEYLRRIRIPDGIFFSAKGLVKRSEANHADVDGDDDYSAGSSLYGGDDFAVSSPMQQSALKDFYPVNSPTSGPQYDRRTMDERHPWPPSSSTVRSTRANSHDSATLPRLSTIAPLAPSDHFSLHSSSPGTLSRANPMDTAVRHLPSAHGSASRSYRPLSPEDRRALSTFKVVI